MGSHDKKKKKHSKGKKHKKHDKKGKKSKSKKFAFFSKKEDSLSDETTKKNKVKKRKQPSQVADEPRKPAKKASKTAAVPTETGTTDDGLIQLTNGNRVQPDSRTNSNEEALPAVALPKKPAQRTKPKLAPVATTPVVKNAGGSDEDASVPIKKPPPPVLVKKAAKPAATAKPRVFKTAKSIDGKEAAPVKQEEKVSDKVKKSSDSNPSAVASNRKNEKSGAAAINFCAGDAASAVSKKSITEEPTKTPMTSGKDGSDEELTKKEQEDKDKTKGGCSNSQAQKWRGFIDKLLMRGIDGIAKEFKVLSSYLPKSATRRAFDQNMAKNRFEDVVCIDQTRVRLINDGYIHASWTEISDTKRAILTQLPMNETAADFWKMVLENDVQVILLLATSFEFNTFDGVATFPGKRDFLHYKGPDQHIRVGEFDRRLITKFWTMHTFCVNNGDRKKFVHLHHYYGWTHGMAPRAIADIWQIQSVLRKYSGPPVYMSLSGCGRAGTFAALEVAHDRLHCSEYFRVDVSECVKSVRNGRMHAVQRPTQLRTVHLLIAEHIINNGYDKTLTDKEKSKLDVLIKSFHAPI